MVTTCGAYNDIFYDIIIITIIVIQLGATFVVNIFMLIRLSKTAPSPSFMEPEFSWPGEQEHATLPYP